MLSCVVWEVAEDAVLSLSVLFCFQSQKDLNRKIGMMGRSRKTLSVSESLLKYGFQATLADEEVEILGSLFSREGIAYSPHHERRVNGL